MICAINQTGKKCISWETEKDSGPFYCPECHAQLQLKKGIVKIHHFAHKPPVNCIYGVGESEEHYRIKKDLYEFFSKQSSCKNCELERKLNGVRPDISLYIKNKPIAIEIQKSTLLVGDIIERTTRYSDLGIYVLWIIPGGYPKSTVHQKTGELVYRIKEWELFLHSLYYGRLYYWVSENKVKAVHFSDYMLYKESSEWYEEGGELVSVGGYQFKAKRLKTIVPLDIELKIDEDFIASDRQSFPTKNWTIPKCKIYSNNSPKWW